jgi:murein DD-endopeptidase MepM/ murein hydrolase activator NlpD
MKQHYFVVVLAHSLHGRLRRIHIPHQALYVVLGLALLGSFSLFGMVSSYLRMTWKVSNYNTLRSEVDTLRTRYRELEAENNQKQEQLASLQLMASEVSVAFGIQRKLAGSDDISAEGPLVPSYNESLEEYNFLKSASFSRFHHTYARSWQKNIVPSLWPVNGRILSRFGERADPFSGEGAIHTGLDISANMGTPVHAAADGIVFRAQFDGGYGRMVVVDHGNGMQTWYAHLSRFEVVPGQEIRRGEVVGSSGASGRVTSPHLHFEVRMGGSPVNPYRYLTRSLVLQQVQPDLPF